MMIKQHLFEYKRIYVWGTGYFCERFRDYFPGNIIGFVDSDRQKQGENVFGKPVYSPDYLAGEKKEETLIIVCARCFEEIFAQIRKIGELSAVYVEDYAMLIDARQEADHALSGDYNSDYHGNIISVAGIQALFLVNGCRKFIEAQVNILNENGYSSFEVAPVRFLSGDSRSSKLLATKVNGRYKGTVWLTDIIKSINEYSGMILHSLYYDHRLMNLLVDSLDHTKPVLYYAHDYYCVCTNRFLNKDGVSCLDENDRLRCEKCELNEFQTELRESHRELFAKENVRVITPSKDMKGRLMEIYSGIEIKVVPHLKYRIISEKVKPRHGRIRVAFLGGIFPIKGWDLFQRLCDDCGDIYEYYYFGQTEDKLPDNLIYVKTTLESGGGMVRNLREHGIEIACILSTWPESYSYTMFEAIEAGCFIVTTNKSGNVCRTVKEIGCGKSFAKYDKMREWFMNRDRVIEELSKQFRCIVDVTDNDDFLKYLQ